MRVQHKHIRAKGMQDRAHFLIAAAPGLQACEAVRALGRFLSKAAGHIDWHLFSTQLDSPRVRVDTSSDRPG